jgi:predicted transposase YbfD/YdcC
VAGCRLLLGPVATKDKSSKITAVPELLEMISLKGAIVTADAIRQGQRGSSQIP